MAEAHLFGFRLGCGSLSTGDGGGGEENKNSGFTEGNKVRSGATLFKGGSGFEVERRLLLVGQLRLLYLKQFVVQFFYLQAPLSETFD